MTRYLGVDCGLSGALAVLELVNDMPTLIDAIDMPVMGVGAKRRVDVIAAAEWIAKYGPSSAFIERAQAMPRQGSSSGFHYGRSTGAIETVVALQRIPITFVEASGWKRKLHLRGGDKESARALALQKFPQQHALLSRKKDHGRAEAALIALTAGRRS
jgi:crossover junction endodeoxyribonuclease RuvC